MTDVTDVHVVLCPGRLDPVYVFERREDAEAFRDAVMLDGGEAILSAETVIDEADAAKLIDTEAAAA